MLRVGTEDLSEVHFQWEGPYTLEELSSLCTARDYGLYQIYAAHPIYGGDVLMYIGKCVKQTFGVRILQESWEWNRDGKRVRAHVGRRLLKPDEPTLNAADWERDIDVAERLLIYAHTPAGNSSGVSSLRQITSIHVYNWGYHGMLMPEVSSRRYIGAYFESDWPEYNQST